MARNWRAVKGHRMAEQRTPSEVRRALAGRPPRRHLRDAAELPGIAIERLVAEQRRDLIESGSPFAEKEPPPS